MVGVEEVWGPRTLPGIDCVKYPRKHGEPELRCATSISADCKDLGQKKNVNISLIMFLY